jgi:hypothetical protein
MASEFEKLLAELKAADEPKPKQKLLVKSSVAKDARDAAELRAMSRPALGLVIKSAVSDAVASGRLSGTTAVAGLKALGLDDDGKTPIASMSGLSREQQRATVDHMVRLGKLTGSEAVELLEKIECGG